MRSFKSLFTLGLILPLIAIKTVSADVLIWASDNRSGQPVAAEQAEWLRYLQSQSQGKTPLITPTQAGVAKDYPMHLNAQADVGALMTSRLATGADAALWVQLNASGLEWVLEQNGQAQQLRTSATSDGLSLGLSWLGMQLQMAAPTALPATDTAPAQSAVATALPAGTLQQQPATQPLDLSQAAPYQHRGTLVAISGVFDGADYLRLTQSIRDLEGIDWVYPATLKRTDVELVVGSASLSSMQLQAMLAQQPWLRRTEQGGLRWDAMALPLPGSANPAVNGPAAVAQPAE